MLLKNNSFNLTLNLLAQYHMMKTTIVKHLLFSYTLGSVCLPQDTTGYRRIPQDTAGSLDMDVFNGI